MWTINPTLEDIGGKYFGLPENSPFVFLPLRPFFEKVVGKTKFTPYGHKHPA